MKSSESIADIAASLASAQSELRNPVFDSANPHFKSKFASLACVRDTITPVLSKHGIAVLQLLGYEDGRVTCETVLTHRSGQWISGTFAVPPTKGDAQGTGSAATYCRRYALMAMVNVVGDEDDDGNAAVASHKAAQQPAGPSDNEKRIRKVADDCIALYAKAEVTFDTDGDTRGFWEVYERAATVVGEDKLILWGMLKDHSKVRTMLKEYAGYAAAEAAKKKVPA